MQIRVDDPRGPEIAELLAAHVAFCRASSPPESTHVLDLDGLRSPEITFWSVWEDACLLGCAALKELGPSHGEIKSMHTFARHRGRGVGTALLDEVCRRSREAGCRAVDLEVEASHARALRLYERRGFRRLDRTRLTLRLA